ncbi:MAG: hypothetical protein IT381_16950 [Deltaproteobacteria bacterium]|nr:hypothetical protein [Deltaproteobacteria bacterium]
MRLTIVISLALFVACKRGPALDTPLPENTTGSCTYKNGFSKREECRDYLGEWTLDAAKKDCAGWGSALVEGAPCSYESRLGYCVLGGGAQFTRVTFPGADTTKCGGSRTGCEVFGGGTFDPSPLCGGAIDDSSLGGPVFEQPVRVCKDPKAGEPPGTSANGQVCTWEMISGVTELGRDFRDYADCDRVRTQRPYYAAPTENDAAREDPRLQEAAYAADLAWLKQQVHAAACVCCHSSTAPEGPSNWFVESPNNFLNSFYGSGLAMGAGWIDSVGFGTYPAVENNGFSRPTLATKTDSIFPTTDPARMKAIFERELLHRGLTRADFADQPYAGGPLDEQRFYAPSACENGEGIGADGALNWSGGKARYVFVLEAGATSPTVPPNLDLPEGTLWRIDVPSAGKPVAPGVIYGAVPEGLTQRFPSNAAPAPLVSGRTYYLYVLADIVVPITRCLFRAP